MQIRHLRHGSQRQPRSTPSPAGLHPICNGRNRGQYDLGGYDRSEDRNRHGPHATAANSSDQPAAAGRAVCCREAVCHPTTPAPLGDLPHCSPHSGNECDAPFCDRTASDSGAVRRRASGNPVGEFFLQFLSCPAAVSRPERESPGKKLEPDLALWKQIVSTDCCRRLVAVRGGIADGHRNQRSRRPLAVEHSR